LHTVARLIHQNVEVGDGFEERMLLGRRRLREFGFEALADLWPAVEIFQCLAVQGGGSFHDVNTRVASVVHIASGRIAQLVVQLQDAGMVCLDTKRSRGGGVPTINSVKLSPMGECAARVVRPVWPDGMPPRDPSEMSG
jgi:hypothetical protein